MGDEVIDGRADTYWLGCVAFWLLTGRRVFEKDTPVATIVPHVNDPPGSVPGPPDSQNLH